MLLGLHLGDSLGATIEFTPPNYDKSNWHTTITGGGILNWSPGDATDDTDLMLAILRAMSPHSLDLAKVKQNFINWLESNPKDVGKTTRENLERLQINLPAIWNAQSQANGSLMRCAPLALLPSEGLMDITKEVCALTHPHPRCILCDQIFISLLQMAIAGKDKQDIYRQALGLAQGDTELYQRILLIPSTPWKLVDTSGYVVHSLVAAVWSLYHHNTFLESVISVVNLGDDADTTGAITGALCGAYYGMNQIPQDMINQLQYHQEIINLVTNLESK